MDFQKAYSAISTFSLEEQARAQAALERVFTQEAFVGRHVRLAAKGPPRDASWMPVALALALPMLEGALPRDEHGTCVMPHKHPLRMKKIRARTYTNAMGRVAYDTKRACDNCDEPIEEREFYCCASGCEIDFCSRCHGKLQQLFVNLDQTRATWVCRFVENVSTYILKHVTGGLRSDLAHCLAFEWPQAMFESLVRVVVDVADASVVHLQDVSPNITAHKEFWHVIGFLQVLYCANTLTASSVSMGSRVQPEKFAVRGIDKCDALVEYSRWCAESSSLVTHAQALKVSPLCITAGFASFLTHSNLVPISFRQRCLQHDVRRLTTLDTEDLKLPGAPRSPASLLKYLLSAFGSSKSMPPGYLTRSLAVTFQGEPAEGRGVTCEFLSLAIQTIVEHSQGEIDTESGMNNASSGMRATADMQSTRRRKRRKTSVSTLDAANVERKLGQQDHDVTMPCKDAHSGSSLFWEYDPQLRTYWFRQACVPADKYEHLYAVMHACGVILGQAIFSGCSLPSFFPKTLYAMLLQEISPHDCKRFKLADIESISPAIAQSLERLLEYEEDDVLELFELDWPRGEELSHDNRYEHVTDYIQWFCSDRYATQLRPLSEGFGAVVGQSRLLRGGLVDAAQLEQIICGAELPVDVEALQRGSSTEGWLKADADYLESFWEILRSFRDCDLRRFATFVSSCSRSPPRGWQDVNLTLQRNGEGDDRLPTAFTCFHLLLLPRYSSKEVLRTKLLLAIAETQGFGLR
jgi:hypothetical protein